MRRFSNPLAIALTCAFVIASVPTRRPQPIPPSIFPARRLPWHRESMIGEMLSACTLSRYNQPWLSMERRTMDVRSFSRRKQNYHHMESIRKAISRAAIR